MTGGATTAQTITLSHPINPASDLSNGLDAENSIARPELITPKKDRVAVEAGKKQSVILDQLPPMSFRVYRVKK
jgi:hypothetical protein